ncbi:MULTISPECIES: tetratricopeptide repeat protein [Spirulina sp. CCY15215]|uniref:tetratricopeptide repeat protein n=1 Tax=Spirulina sp. CCY15215 TaxID=2767591 RepID=UPI00194FF10F|nr:tetratricopeptide repeat protein [Spirulina major]
MLDRVAEAIKRQDYRGAAKLLKPLIDKDGKNPWVRFYAGRIQEGLGKREAAEKIYLYLLPKTTNPKLIAQIRKGISRLEIAARSQKEQAIADAVTTQGGESLGVLILEPIAPAAKQEAAKAFGKIVNLDAYTARLRLPTRGWRLYRPGKMGELVYYVSRFQQVNIPSFCFPLSQIEAIEVLEVHYFKTLNSQILVRCKSSAGSEGEFSFTWPEVTQRVIGRIPLFESVVVFGARRKLQRKIQKQDSVPFCDLHLPQRNCILRFCDRTYQFQKGVTFATKPTSLPLGERETASKNWHYLTEFLDDTLSKCPVRDDFTIFAETAIDFRETLDRLKSRIDLERRKPSLWDQAFQLYSGLHFWRDR